MTPCFGVHFSKYSIPPGYKNKKGKKYPKIGDYKEKIDKILKEDLEIGKKQRHTSKRIYDRLKKEDGYSGSYDAVRRYVYSGLKNQDKILRILLPIIKQHFSMPLNKHSWAFYSQC